MLVKDAKTKMAGVNKDAPLHSSCF